MMVEDYREGLTPQVGTAEAAASQAVCAETEETHKAAMMVKAVENFMVSLGV